MNNLDTIRAALTPDTKLTVLEAMHRYQGCPMMLCDKFTTVGNTSKGYKFSYWNPETGEVFGTGSTKEIAIRGCRRWLKNHAPHLVKYLEPDIRGVSV